MGIRGIGASGRMERDGLPEWEKRLEKIELLQKERAYLQNEIEYARIRLGLVPEQKRRIEAIEAKLASLLDRGASDDDNKAVKRDSG